MMGAVANTCTVSRMGPAHRAHLGLYQPLPIPCAHPVMHMVWRLVLYYTCSIEDWTSIVIIVVIGTALMKE